MPGRLYIILGTGDREHFETLTRIGGPMRYSNPKCLDEASCICTTKQVASFLGGLQMSVEELVLAFASVLYVSVTLV